MAPDASAGRALHAGRGPVLGGLGEGVVAMAALSLADALERLRADEKNNDNAPVATLVLRDKALQSVIACWPMVKRSFPDCCFDEDTPLDVLWGWVKFDERDVVELSGLSTGVALAALRRAKGNRLIFPDGSVHHWAKLVLQQVVKGAFKS